MRLWQRGMQQWLGERTGGFPYPGFCASSSARRHRAQQSERGGSGMPAMWQRGCSTTAACGRVLRRCDDRSRAVWDSRVIRAAYCG